VCFRHAGLFIYSFNVNVRPLIAGERSFIAHPASLVQAIRVAAFDPRSALVVLSVSTITVGQIQR
jgi:hypothetical protein